MRLVRVEASPCAHACAAIAAMGLASICLSGCIQIIGLENKKDPVPPGDGAEDTLPDPETDEDARDVPTDDAADPEDAPGDADGYEAEDRLDAEDTAPEPDGLDSPEIPPGLVWIPIPGDSFEMGCSTGDSECQADENPHHPVTVSPFEMTETEITQGQYESVTGENPSNHICAECPVEQVSWEEARAFCEAIGGRLPSEAEWEYAARAGSASRYSCGDDPECLDGIAWFLDNSGPETHPVGEKPANDFDLHDMLGNVWEWTGDCLHDDYTGAPSTAEVWSGGDCDFKIFRGGSSYELANSLRVSNRAWQFYDPDRKEMGFRCCR